MIYPQPNASPVFTRRRVGLLGGSFNPAHDGHRDMSLFAIKRLHLDEIWWVVSPQNPLKPTRDMAPFKQRMAKARAIARHPRIAVTDIEMQLKTRYTVDTLRALCRRFPHTDFVWLMGADNLQQIPRWRRWPEIFGMVPVAIFRRSGFTAGCGRGVAANRFADAWRDLRHGKKLARMAPPVWLVLDNPLNLLSGTAIRRQNAR